MVIGRSSERHYDHVLRIFELMIFKGVINNSLSGISSICMTFAPLSYNPNQATRG